ncbi:bifunctional biotin--[acetyl-CoA-carboxylase] ligase/biotin operon repressor BirA [Psychrobium sp. 1_MG-2023]|uniref:bifunctional biotin--[acetyl-CoA-carboxylase] ligase/biotin operon repressor BirA n=1 Tax=Psychrobium sp. 1_MG-2023 TaxID=3062624 RepID=UPI000C32A70B|nr:bifunctional biotin--[acetyl-CoA-carboxylase] ligase/biotin operon repressor BirA [Psychrobium sp. 1_MG-2023]MDP2562549.1 bifunctional biotin--[acetyl-CoA-carboxylase] ligase/biotin operon repressor BirA [Psychrobium sp. 1_MG-2023]PKF54431.1 biotin--[acetyl-CoA-carboxylase] synthetase [Alteromonadales bacterium alter-6D02]
MFNATTQKILSTMAAGQFCSGEELGQLCGISRAAIGKHIQALQQLGLDIYSVTGKGYRLATPITLLQQGEISRLLGDNIEHQVAVETVVGSTNELIKDKIKQGELISAASGYTVFAEAQTAGRGRRGRTWASPLGASLYFSMHWRFEQGISATMGLSLAVGIALSEALVELGVNELGLKWPNDVYYQGRKLAGILIELEGQGSDSCDIVIGVGINVQLPDSVTEQIDQPFADLAQTGINLDRNVIAATILRHLMQVMNTFEQRGFSAFVERWNVVDCFVGTPVNLLIGQRTISGISRGVDAQGGIVVESDGEQQTYYGGEISLRKQQ